MTFAARTLFGAVVPLVVSLLACGGDPSGSSAEDEQFGSRTSASAPAPESDTAAFENRFMTEMIHHHMMAVMMAEACVDKAVHPELRQMCSEIIAAQSAEVADMQSWLLAWYGATHEPEMTPDAERQMERLASLEGGEFEIAFMQEMVRHHLAAVREGRMCLADAYHPELLALCGNIVEGQTAEIAQMQRWLCEWYELCQG
jgi:uncharacterized protein (DUF305 family)